jgi:hypothetical protein
MLLVLAAMNPGLGIFLAAIAISIIGCGVSRIFSDSRYASIGFLISSLILGWVSRIASVGGGNSYSLNYRDRCCHNHCRLSGRMRRKQMMIRIMYPSCPCCGAPVSEYSDIFSYRSFECRTCKKRISRTSGKRIVDYTIIFLFSVIFVFGPDVYLDTFELANGNHKKYVQLAVFILGLSAHWFTARLWKFEEVI